MRAFITGGSGYIGSAIVQEFVAAGIDVVALVRSDASKATVEALGATPHLGQLGDGASYKDVASGCDVLIHAASEKGADVAKTDKACVDTLLSLAHETPRQCIFTSGVWVLGNTGDTPAMEDASTEGALPKVAWRPPHEQQVLAANSDSFRTSVIRPGMVYGERRGLIAPWFITARDNGAAEFVGDGDNRWSFIYRGDLARYYRRLVETQAQGMFHCVDGKPLTVSEAAKAASQAAGAGGKLTPTPHADAKVRLGALADALCLDQVVGSTRNEELDWAPTYASFLDAAGAMATEALPNT